MAKLEEKSLQELTQTKKKLLKIIKDNAIPPNSLNSHYFVLPLEGVDNILTELEIFEEGERLNISGFKSDNFETFLYDIASNLLNLGHKSLLQEFLASDQEYKNYHYEPDSKFIIMSNKNGNFIFSKTLKLRREQSRFIEKTEKFELWGAFNAFLKFQKAFLEKSKNNDFEYISQKYCGAGRNWQERSEAVDIIFFAQDLDEIVAGKDSNQRRNSIHTLKKDDFKNYATVINAHLIKELSRDKITSSKISDKKENIILHLSKNGELWREPKAKNCYPIEERSDRHKIVRYFVEKELYDYYPTQQIANDLELTTKDIMKKIGEINNTVLGKLKIKNKILENKRSSGYRLNPKYKIIAEK